MLQIMCLNGYLVKPCCSQNTHVNQFKEDKVPWNWLNTLVFLLTIHRVYSSLCLEANMHNCKAEALEGFCPVC